MDSHWDILLLFHHCKYNSSHLHVLFFAPSFFATHVPAKLFYSHCTICAISQHRDSILTPSSPTFYYYSILDIITLFYGIAIKIRGKKNLTALLCDFSRQAHIKTPPCQDGWGGVFGRDDKIRTCGLCVPNAALYQTEPHLDVLEDRLPENRREKRAKGKSTTHDCSYLSSVLSPLFSKTKNLYRVVEVFPLVAR